MQWPAVALLPGFSVFCPEYPSAPPTTREVLAPNSSAKLHFSFGPDAWLSLTSAQQLQLQLPRPPSRRRRTNATLCQPRPSSRPSLPERDSESSLAFVSSTARIIQITIAGPCLHLGQQHDAARLDNRLRNPTPTTTSNLSQPLDSNPTCSCSASRPASLSLASATAPDCPDRPFPCQGAAQFNVLEPYRRIPDCPDESPRALGYRAAGREVACASFVPLPSAVSNTNTWSAKNSIPVPLSSRLAPAQCPHF